MADDVPPGRRPRRVTRRGYATLLGLLAQGCAADEAAAGRDGRADQPAMAELDAAAAAPVDATAADLAAGACPDEMVQIGRFCVDRYEAHVVELSDGGERPHSPFLGVAELAVAARSSGGVTPQGYISQLEAAAACVAAGKRLCTAAEFALACRGDDPADAYPYGGATRKPGYCNEGKGSSVARFFGNDPQKWTYAEFNDARLNRWDGGLAETGAYPRCVSPAGVYDCVGNLHEWGADPPDPKGHGRFRGGFYGDAEVNGPGCRYVTSAHEPGYHDYSTGFRCCRDAA